MDSLIAMKGTQIEIVHITAHMGAGVGKAISGISLATKKYSTRIVLLERPEKTEHIENCLSQGIDVIISPDDSTLDTIMRNADVLIINWWHHPSMFRVFMMLQDIQGRIVLWSHVNGLFYPVISPQFADCFDACMFTSEVSMHPIQWTDEEHKKPCKKSQLVYGMGNFVPSEFKHKEDYLLHLPVRIGYVGSLDFAKLHTCFFKYCYELINRGVDVKFYLAGDINQAAVDEVRRLNISDNIEFLGFRKDIPELLTKFDIFVYLLNPNNFATTENALLEAMAAGLPIIASNGVVEKSIIQNQFDGILVDSVDMFVDTINEFINNEEYRIRIGTNARKTVLQKYDLEKNVERFTEVIEDLIKENKRFRSFDSVIGSDPYSWFLSACKKQEQDLFHSLLQRTSDILNQADNINNMADIFKGHSKGSVFQFYRTFPQNKELQKICNALHFMEEKDI